MTKIKDIERILKVTIEKQLVTDKGTPTWSSADFWVVLLQARRLYTQDIFRRNEMKIQQQILYLTLPIIEIEGDIKCFTSK